MNNSINLTLDEQFDKDCKVIKLKYEYPGYTGEEKWAIITGLTEAKQLGYMAQNKKEVTK